MATSRSTTPSVRGIEVDCSVEAINTLFGLTPPIETEFDRLSVHATEEELDEMVTDLGQPDTYWTPHKSYMLRTFKATNLLPNANVWMNFIRHSLSPTTHDSSISVDRMILLHCIMNGESLNTGDIIAKRMRYCAGRAQGKLFFPGLVHKLCKQAGVPELETDEIVKEGVEKWTIGLKEVTRLREKPAKTGGEMVGVVQTLVEQNKDLTEALLKLQTAGKEETDSKIREARAEWKAETKEKRKELKGRLKRMRKEKEDVEARNAQLQYVNDRLNEENSKMMRTIRELRQQVKEGAAASNAAALPEGTATTQPTPME